MHSSSAKAVCQAALPLICTSLLCQCSSLGPSVAVEGDLSSPETSLPRYEYPFDESGRYREDWVSPPSSSQRSASRTRNSTSASTRNPVKPVLTPSSLPTSAPVVVPAVQTGVARSQIEGKSPSEAPLRVQGRGSHKVSNGDTLWSISRRYGLSVTDMKTVNGFKADTILPGQVILIP